jgi:hypothetical protein
MFRRRRPGINQRLFNSASHNQHDHDDARRASHLDDNHHDSAR